MKRILFPTIILFLFSMCVSAQKSLPSYKEVVNEFFNRYDLKESQDLLFAVREEIKKICEEYLRDHAEVNTDDLRSLLKSRVHDMLIEATAKKPVIMPIIITI